MLVKYPIKMNKAINLLLLAFVLASITCQLMDYGVVYSEKTPLSDLQRMERRKLDVLLGEHFYIDIPSTFARAIRWNLHRVSGHSHIKCEDDPRNEKPEPKTSKLAEEDPQVKPIAEEDNAKFAAAPRQSFSCVAIKPGRAMLEFWYIEVMKKKPQKKYFVQIKVKRCRTPRLAKFH